jgi:hypothetical protein
VVIFLHGGAGWRFWATRTFRNAGLGLRRAAAGLKLGEGDEKLGTQSDLLASIDALIECLSAPLASADKRAGWNERLQMSWRKHFIDLRERIAHGDWPRDERHHLMRWLNIDGIGLGPLAEQFASLQQQLREHDSEPLHEGTTGRATRRFLDELGIPRKRRRRG